MPFRWKSQTVASRINNDDQNKKADRCGSEIYELFHPDMLAIPQKNSVKKSAQKFRNEFFQNQAKNQDTEKPEIIPKGIIQKSLMQGCTEFVHVNFGKE